MNSLVAFAIIIVNDDAGISTAILAPKAGITAFSHMNTYKTTTLISSERI